MTCPHCNGTLYAAIPGGVAPCNAREAGRRMIESREAHGKRWRGGKRESKPLTKRGVAKIWKEQQGK